MKYYQSRLAVMMLSLALAGCNDEKTTSYFQNSQKEEVVATPILLTPYEIAQPFLGSDDKYHLVYGLMLPISRQLPAEIEKVEVLNGVNNAQLQTLKGKNLLRYLVHLDSSPAEELNLERDSSRMLFIALEFDKQAEIPHVISHKFTGKAQLGPGGKVPSNISYEAGAFCLPANAPLVIAPPLEGNGWAVFNGCCSFKGAHQTSMMGINGVLYNPQRFAIDFMQLNDNDHLVEGDPSVPANWVSYNAKVLAVANGTVVGVLEGLPDQLPGQLPDPTTINAKNATGNHVVIKLGDSVYAFYAHLKNGSIKVKVGDQVRIGDHIANLGNTGNTSAPHLHLHLMNTPSPIAGEPVSYMYDNFRLVGTITPESLYDADKLDGALGNRKTFKVKQCKGQLPMDLSIVDFN